MLVLATLLAGCLSDTAEYPVLDAKGLGRVVTENKGAPSIVVYWATWCPGCMKEIPALESLKKKAGDELHVAAVSVNDSPEALEKFFGGETNLDVYRATDELLQRRMIGPIPRSDVYDVEGNVLYTVEGYAPMVLDVLARSVAHPDEFTKEQHETLKARFPAK